MRVRGCSRLPVPPARMTPFIGRIIVQRVGDQPPSPGAPRTAFAPDGVCWWDGSQWRPAISPDGLWRWNGRAWEPARPGPRPGAGGGTATAAVITVAAFAGVLVLVSIVVVVILLTMGNQIANVFSNVVAALNG